MRTGVGMPYSWGFAVGLVLLVLYFLSDRSILHRSVVERIFWPVVSGWFGFYCVMCLRTPSGQGGYGCEGFGVFDTALMVGIAALAGALGYEQRQSIRLASSLEREDFKALARTQHKETVPARIATSSIVNILAKQDRSRLSQAITGWRVRKQVYTIMKECCHTDPANLMYLLNSREINLPQLFSFSSNSDVLSLLIEQISYMDVVTKAKLIDAFHRQPDFIYLRQMQELVVSILMQTNGWELNALKGLIDGGGDFYNLHKLVFRDLDGDFADKVLKHIETEGAELYAAMTDETTPGGGGWVAPLKILSDVDDTLYCSGGHFPAGVDDRFPSKMVYPGVLALFRELDHQRHGQPPTQDLESGGNEESFSLWLRRSSHDWVQLSMEPSQTVADLKEELAERIAKEGCMAEFSLSSPMRPPMPNLAFLSARPHIYKDYIERKSYDLFLSLRAEGSLHCTPTLLAGRLRSSAGAMLGGVAILLCDRLRTPWRAFRRQTSFSNLNLADQRTALLQRQRLSAAAWRSVGDAKVNTFLQYERLYCEYSMVFFGDNGQGDLWCGEEIARRTSKENGGPLAAVFIHEVASRSVQLTSFPEHDQQEAWRRRHVHFHKTYLGAALNAHKEGLISLEALSRVGAAAVEDLVRARIDHADSNCAWLERITELNDDVDVANEVLQAKGAPRSLLIEYVPDEMGMDPKSSVGAFMQRSSQTRFSFKMPPPRRRGQSIGSPFGHPVSTPNASFNL